MNSLEDQIASELRQQAEAVPPASGDPQRVKRAGRTRLLFARVGTATASLAVLVILVGFPVFLLSDRGLPSDAASSDPAEPEISSEKYPDPSLPVPPEVAAYRAQAGTLQAVGAEDGWLCPARGLAGYTLAVPESETPAALKLVLPGKEAIEQYDEFDGPQCHQPPTLILIDFSDESKISANTAIAVWPNTTRLEDQCPQDARCSFTTPPETLTLNDQPATLRYHAESDSYNLFWIDTTGTPMYAVASGLEADELTGLASIITINVDTHEATLPVLPGSEVGPDLPALPEGVEALFDRIDDAWIEPSTGVWDDGHYRMIAYLADGPPVAVSTTFDASFNPYARLAFGVTDSELVDINGAVGVRTLDGGWLTYRTDSGTVVQIETQPGDNTLHPVEVALSLRP